MCVRRYLNSALEHRVSRRFAARILNLLSGGCVLSAGGEFTAGRKRKLLQLKERPLRKRPNRQQHRLMKRAVCDASTRDGFWRTGHDPPPPLPPSGPRSTIQSAVLITPRRCAQSPAMVPADRAVYAVRSSSCANIGEVQTGGSSRISSVCPAPRFDSSRATRAFHYLKGWLRIAPVECVYVRPTSINVCSLRASAVRASRDYDGIHHGQDNDGQRVCCLHEEAAFTGADHHLQTLATSRCVW